MLYPKITIENKNNTNLFHLIGKEVPAFGVLNQVIIRSHPTTGLFMSNDEIYDQIAENIGTSRFTVKRVLMQFRDAGFLIPAGQGKYTINRNTVQLDYKKGVWVEGSKSTNSKDTEDGL